MRNEMCGVWVCSGLSVWKILDKNSWVDVWMPWPPIPTTQTVFLNFYTQHKPLLSGFGTHGHWRYWHNAIILHTVWCPWAGGETNHLLWSAGGSAVGAARPGPHRTFRHSCDWRHRPQTFSPRLHYYLLVMLRNIKLNVKPHQLLIAGSWFVLDHHHWTYMPWFPSFIFTPQNPKYILYQIKYELLHASDKPSQWSLITLILFAAPPRSVSETPRRNIRPSAIVGAPLKYAQGSYQYSPSVEIIQSPGIFMLFFIAQLMRKLLLSRRFRILLKKKLI